MYTNTKSARFVKEHASLFKTRSRRLVNDVKVVHLLISFTYLTLRNTGICLYYNVSVLMLKTLIFSDNLRFSNTYYTFLSIGSSMCTYGLGNGGK